MASTAELVTESVADLTAGKQDEPKKFLQMTINEKFKYIREVITVEPLIGTYVIAALLCGPALQYLEFEKACRADLSLNDTVCDAILTSEHSNYTDENIQIQTLIANMHSWQSPIQSIAPVILVLFLGSYSDRHKLRKPFLLLPIFGELFSVVGCILSVLFMKQWGLVVLGVVQTVVPSFFGGQTMIVMAVFAYIADVSTLEMRTLRVGIVQIVLNVCSPLVQSFSGILFFEVGYIPIFLIAGCCYAFGIGYGYFLIKEPKTPEIDDKKSLIADLFDPRHAYETFMLLFKKSPGNKRLMIFLVLLTLFIYSGVNIGEATTAFLYFQHVFSWTVVEFSYFSTVNTLVHLIGTLLAVPLFTTILKLSDVFILILTFLDKILTNIIFGFANNTTMVYVAAVVSIITGVSSIAIRSLATKIVSINDLGKTQSLFGICEAIAPAIFVPIYNKGIYLNTTNFPAAFFFFGALLYIICIVFILVVFIQEKRLNAIRKKDEDKLGTHEKALPLEDVVTHI